MSWKYWIVWNERTGISPAKKHATEQDARKEAERLAEKQPGDTFVVFESTGSVVAKSVEWTMHALNTYAQPKV